LTAKPDRLPAFYWLLLVPPAILVSTALYLHLHWSSIPVRYPIHWGTDGQANGWATRSFRGVYGPLVFAGLWMAWFTAMAFVIWYRSPRSSMRIAVAKTLIAVDLLFGLIWPAISLSSRYKPNPGVLALIIVAGTLAVVGFSVAMLRNAATDIDKGASAAAHSRSGFFDRHNSSLLIPPRRWPRLRAKSRPSHCLGVSARTVCNHLGGTEIYLLSLTGISGIIVEHACCQGRTLDP
jgi:hypothetical protein